MIGLTFEEKILNFMSLNDYLKKISNFHVFDSLEISLTEDMLSVHDLKELQDSNFNFSFHMPYQVKKYPFDSKYLSTDLYEHKKASIKFLDFANAFKTSDTAMLVLHGSENQKKDINLSYLDYLLDYIEKKQYNIIFALENLHSDYITYSLTQVHELVSSFSNPNLKICYDIPNHYMLNKNVSLPDSNIIREIIHCHIHGFNDSSKHMAIDQASYEIIKKLSNKIDIPLYNFELLWSNEYWEELNNSIPYLASLIKRS